MSVVNITNINVLQTTCQFQQPYMFEITFECLSELSDDLEFKLIYVGSADDEKLDQELDSILVGPVPVGINRFVFETDPPDISKIPEEELLGVTVVLLTCSYKNKEFVRVGYYVNNEYIEEELKENPPEKPIIEKIHRIILADKPRVTRFPINWYVFLTKFKFLSCSYIPNIENALPTCFYFLAFRENPDEDVAPLQPAASNDSNADPINTGDGNMDGDNPENKDVEMNEEESLDEDEEDEEDEENEEDNDKEVNLEDEESLDEDEDEEDEEEDEEDVIEDEENAEIDNELLENSKTKITSNNGSDQDNNIDTEMMEEANDNDFVDEVEEEGEAEDVGVAEDSAEDEEPTNSNISTPDNTSAKTKKHLDPVVDEKIQIKA
ncbi:hypothetical protein BB558_004486 [Smittium angustum]|uniref:Anti-silencing function protein 1 n=1 Tax=Smittium angustum TaxID=133377 RepID=A0A2U1J3E8_SMIAN|nr:hypothetical protein BB558_004486 [Smittium angustum]